MEVRNCRKCGKMFNFVGGQPICQGCKDKIEAKFQEVKEFVRENKTATMNQISENCDVDRKQIEQWVREERLVFSDESPIKMTCESCGAIIMTGRFCEKCKKDTVNSLAEAGKRMPNTQPVAHDKRDNGSRMYTFKK
jgi:hypothetical protein